MKVFQKNLYAEDTVVEIEAIANAGYQFDHWTGDVADSSSPITTVTMNSEKTVTAFFTALEFIRGDADGNGKIDIFDALLIAEYDAGLWDDRLDLLIPNFEAIADADNNGTVNINDALEEAKYDAGLDNLLGNKNAVSITRLIHLNSDK